MIAVTLTDLGESEVQIAGEIAAAVFDSFRPAALELIGRQLPIDGFRPGLAPATVVARAAGEDRVLTKMAELALSRSYPEIIKEQKLDVLGRPEITITKMAAGNPLAFRLKTAVAPKFTLPDYRAAAKKFPPEGAPAVSADEVTKLISEIQKSRQSKDGALPEVTDAWAKELNPEFRDLAHFKEVLSSNLLLEKTNQARDKRRLKIIEELVGRTTIVLPKLLVEAELNKMVDELKQAAEEMKLPFEQYLSHLKKTEAELRTDWQPKAAMRVKTALILNAIAAAERFTAEEAVVEQELEGVLKRHPGADREAARSYVTSVLVNEKVWHLLEEGSSA